MKEVLVYCEGPTEETFINRILADYLAQFEVYLTASSCGGVSRYAKIQKELKNFCKSSNVVVTTMLDYYGIPSDTPGMRDEVPGDPYAKVEYVEQAIAKDLAQENLIPNLMLHEFEALLFAEPTKFQYCGLRPSAIRELQGIREHAETPEHINNNPNTAPSKRILRIYPQYIKPSDGFQIAKDIGLDTMLSECRHFARWVEKLKALADT